MRKPPSPKTVAEAREAGFRPRSVRAEIRDNLLRKLAAREPLFPGIHGYEDTVFPAVENALLAEQDLLFLGERGQGKSRLIRSLLGLLDEWIPELAGSEVHDDPAAPISAQGRLLLAEHGERAPIRWLHRDERYGEKLATPDVSTADLIGDVDPMRVVEGRSLGDELTMHYGILPRTNRGIFCINELPDLTEKIQVALFNVMEERDVQIKGYRVRLPLDVLVVASANPEDYTSRGRIVTPLKDRFAAQIRTHYPRTRAIELQIVEQEAVPLSVPGVEVVVPSFMKKILAEITFQARQSPDVSQSSGVSVRMTVASYETLVANAVRRALRNGDRHAVPRISDLWALHHSMLGKIELEYAGKRSEDELVKNLIARAVKVVFDGAVSDAASLDAIAAAFGQGWMVEVSDMTPAAEFLAGLDKIPGLRKAVAQLAEGETPAMYASAVELILEGLHLSNRLNKTTSEHAATYAHK